MSAHCDCNEDEQDHYQVDVSLDHYDGESWATKYHNCGGLVKMHI